MAHKLLTGEWFIEKTSAHRRRVIHYWATILWLTVGLVVWIILRDALWFVGFMSLYAICHPPRRLGGRNTCRGGDRGGGGWCVGKRSRGGGAGGDRADLVRTEAERAPNGTVSALRCRDTVGGHPESALPLAVSRSRAIAPGRAGGG